MTTVRLTSNLADPSSNFARWRAGARRSSNLDGKGDRIMDIPALALLVAAALTPASASAATTEQTLIALEKQSWAAWQNMDAEFWKGFLSDDHIEVSGFVGSTGKADVIRGIVSKVCKVASYKVDDFQFRQIDPNTAVLIYRAEQDTSCAAVKVPSPVWATSLFQKRGGRWQNVLYEQTPALVPPAKK
jgi:uncharacterized protein DUF4440